LGDVGFHNMKDQDWDLIHRVHVRGAYKVTKAAWPYMREQNYGRIIMTSSAAGIYGSKGQANYSSAKLALYAFGKSLSLEGGQKNILVNSIAPVAGSRMTATVLPDDLVKALKPEYVAPLVIWLCHEDSKINGELFEVGAGWISQLRWQRTKGAFFPIDKDLSPEQVRDHWDAITDWTNAVNPASITDSTMIIFENLNNKGENTVLPPKKQSQSTKSENNDSEDSAELKSAKVFEEIEKKIKGDGASLVKKVGGIYEFVINGPGGKSVTWGVDLKNGSGKVLKGKPEGASVTITASDDDFVAIMTGKMNSQQAFMQGKLKISGNMGLAMKLSVLSQGQSKL